MIRGVYTAAGGMAAQMRRQQVIANDLANLGTTGYKQDGTSLTAFPSLMMRRVGTAPAQLGQVGTGVIATGGHLDLTQGSLRLTERPLDLALSGRGFFVVRTPDGDFCTRAGSFQLSPERMLVDPRGNPVLGENGPITVPPGELSVRLDGSVHVGDALVSRLAIVDGRPEDLAKVGDNLLANGNPEPVPGNEVRIVQGYLEESNVDSVRVMIEAMAALRAYEASQRALKMQDSTLTRAIEQVGKV